MSIEYYSKQSKLNTMYPSYTDLDRIFRYFEDKEEIGVDTETTGFSCHTDSVLSVQLGDKNKQFVVDTSTIPLKELKYLFESDKLHLLQNAQFDLQFLYKYDIFPTNIYDTLLAECIILGGLGDKGDIKDVKDLLGIDVANEYVDRELGLDALALKYCNITLDKTIRSFIHREGMSDRVIKYGADDVKWLPDIRKEQLKILKGHEEKYGIDSKVLELENEVVKVFSRMAFNGVKVNSVKYKENVITVAKKEINKVIIALDDAIHTEPKLSKYKIHQGNLFFQSRTTEINWNSSTQKLKILKILNPSIKDTAANTIRKEIKHPLGKHLLKYNKFKKLEAAFGDKFLNNINKNTLRMHPSIWQILNY